MLREFSRIERRARPAALHRLKSNLARLRLNVTDGVVSLELKDGLVRPKTSLHKKSRLNLYWVRIAESTLMVSLDKMPNVRRSRSACEYPQRDRQNLIGFETGSVSKLPPRFPRDFAFYAWHDVALAKAGR